MRVACWVLRGSIVAVALLCVRAPVRLCAQSDPRLIAAVRLAQDGQGDSARIQVKRIIDATPVANPLYAEAIYTAGVVASSTAEMERQFQRLVVEYNGSAWADDALLRLTQLNFARGDLAGVIRNAERLASDYPQSEVLPETALWAARAYFRQQDNTNGCRWTTDGLARADTMNMELRNGLVFLNGRCGVAVVAPPTDSAARRARVDSVLQVPTGVPTTGRPTGQRPDECIPYKWAVQVASSSTTALANDLVARMTRQGLTGGFVEQSGTSYKVRIGGVCDRAAADALLARVRVHYPQAFVIENTP